MSAPERRHRRRRAAAPVAPVASVALLAMAVLGSAGCVEISLRDGSYTREVVAGQQAVGCPGCGGNASSGSADAKVDMMLSNSSTFVEVGNLCLGLRGEVGLLQFGGSATVSPFVTETVELPLSRGEPHVFDALFDAL